MASPFPDEDFIKACEEMDSPNLQGWDLFVEHGGYTIYRLYDPVSGLYQYKSFGLLEDISPQVCAEVFEDIEYRRQWDPYLNEVYNTEEDGVKVTYWQVNFPFPMANRDYVFRREVRCLDHRGRKVWVARVESVPSRIPERSGVVRVDMFTQTCVLTSDGKSGTRSYLHHFDNPKSVIPPMVFNWLAKVAVPQMLLAIKKACTCYPTYRRERLAASTSTYIERL